MKRPSLLTSAPWAPNRRPTSRAVPRTAKLKNLPPDQQAAVFHYSKGKTLVQVAKWLQKKVGLQVSPSAVHYFLAWYGTTDRLEYYAAIVQALLEYEKKKDPNITPQRLYELGQEFFTGLVMRNEDVRGWSAVQQIALKQGRLDLDWEKFRDQAADRKARLQAALNDANPKPGG